MLCGVAAVTCGSFLSAVSESGVQFDWKLGSSGIEEGVYQGNGIYFAKKWVDSCQYQPV